MKSKDNKFNPSYFNMFKLNGFKKISAPEWKLLKKINYDIILVKGKPIVLTFKKNVKRR